MKRDITNYTFFGTEGDSGRSAINLTDQLTF